MLRTTVSTSGPGQGTNVAVMVLPSRGRTPVQSVDRPTDIAVGFSPGGHELRDTRHMATKSAVVIVAVAAALAGGGVGAFIASAVMEPEVVVETKTETVTKTVSEEVETTPDTCLRAL